MLKHINFDSAHVIVEFGPGTGVFTRQIYNQMKNGTKFFVFELHEPFFDKLSEEYLDKPNVYIINDSAANVEKYLNEKGVEAVDFIISSLPLTNFDEELTREILTNSEHVLNQNGKFIQFQYSLNAKKALNKIFILNSIQFTPINFPPAFIYTCEKK